MRLTSILFFISLLVVGGAQAHPQHATYAELSLNQQGSSIQVAIKVIPEDLESILSVKQQSKILLVDDAKVDNAILSYLWQSFLLTDEKGEQLPFEWVGKEVDHKAAWLYFTADLSAKPVKQVYLQNKILLDYQASYINHVSLKKQDNKSFIFAKNTKKQLLYRF